MWDGRYKLSALLAAFVYAVVLILYMRGMLQNNILIVSVMGLTYHLVYNFCLYMVLPTITLFHE